MLAFFLLLHCILYVKVEVELVDLKSESKYIIYVKVGEKLYGYVELTKKLRLGGVQKRLSNAQWETRKGNALEAAESCKQAWSHACILPSPSLYPD